MKIKFRNQEWNLIGEQLKVGDYMPNFQATDTELESINFNNSNNITIFSIFPSINTRVCDLQTIGINKLAKSFSNLDFVAISLDLPTALKEWCVNHEVNNIKVVSDYKNREFGLKTGFLIDELFLLDRGIIVVNKDNQIIYLSKNTDVHEQINFEELTIFLQKL